MKDTELDWVLVALFAITFVLGGLFTRLLIHFGW